MSNNAFDYEERQKTHSMPYLHVPSLLETYDLNSLKVGREIVFEALDDEEKLKSCLGLEHFLKVPFHEKAMGKLAKDFLNSSAKITKNLYIFDNHNHAFYFWHLERFEGKLEDGATLIHIDQHKDTRIPVNFLSSEKSKNLKETFDYTNTILNVGNFIPPAVKTGLIKNIIFIDSESSLQQFANQLEDKMDFKNLILDIDIDFFAPELDYINNDLKVSIIQKLLPRASTTTIATSPFFIDQELAIHWIKRIFSEVLQ